MKELIIVVAISFLCSCSSIYIPQTPNIPLHKEKGETNLNAGLNTNSFVINGSHSITDKYAIIGGVNISYGNVSEMSDIGDILYSGAAFSIFPSEKPFKHSVISVGGGLFKLLNKLSVWELYGGIDLGNATGLSNNNFKNQYGNIYFQSNIGISKSHFEVGGMLKLNVAYMDYQYPDYYDIVHQDQIPVFSIQTGGILRIGGDMIKFWFSPSLNFSKAFVDSNYEDMELDLNNGKFYTFGNISIGINCRF